MVCWLKFLKFVNDTLKEAEPNLARRKRLAIEILKDMEKEEGHNIAKIEKKLKKEGKKGLILRLKKKKKQKDEDQEEEAEETLVSSEKEEEYEGVYTCSED